MKVVSNHLASLKEVQEIRLVDSQLNVDRCKILADSLMRMKKLRIFRVSDSNILGLGLSSLVYNLAFSPNMLMLDISRNTLGSNANDIKEIIISMQKLL